MKPVDILKVLDLAKVAREQGNRFTPLFAGEAGLGKSEICQEWVKQQRAGGEEYGFIDLRLAYREGPDVIGLPKIIEMDGQDRTSNILPEFWPTGGKGLLLIEEPNRANSSVMNCLMQILTDRKVDKYSLPEGWVMAGCINPENTGYDVNTMDAALKNRFEIFDIKYDHASFIDFMIEQKYHHNVLNFVKSGVWQYKTSTEIGETGQYISPRTFSKLNTAEMAGAASTSIYFNVVVSALGEAVGREYYKFCTDTAPVMAKDLVSNPKEAFKRLEKYCDVNAYKGDLVNVTIQSLIENYGVEIDGKKVSDEIVIKVAKMLPKDQTVNLLKGITVEKTDGAVKLNDFIAKDKELVEALRRGLREVK